MFEAINRHLADKGLTMRRVRCRVLAKNTVQLYTLFGMGNLVLVKRRLCELDTLNPSRNNGKLRKWRKTVQKGSFEGVQTIQERKQGLDFLKNVIRQPRGM
ncbi:MAG: hypothetical protein FJ184_17390 [Gammaproteobacteria bacterium]|nr:hypothetical protein [Gammaproteobacteria bacterium]